MIPLETVSHGTFAPLIGRTFVAATANGPVELHLAELTLLGHKRDETARDPFSLAFRGPQGLRLPQGTYSLTCEAIGEIGLFITQVSDGPRGSEFEAIFT